MRSALLGIGLLLLPGACASPARTAAPPTARPVAATHTAPDEAGPPAARADGRLPDLARPVAYHLAFDIDPTQDHFGGDARIDVSLPRATRFIVLHARGFEPTAVHATDAHGQVQGHAQPRAAAGTVGEAEELVLTFDRALEAGTASVRIMYRAPFDPALRGLYRVQTDGRWYAFTQFEPTDARRAFPCFDEPGYKVPWEVSIDAPEGMLAVANMPETDHTPRTGDAHGTHYRFAATPPMPSYLVAVAVGAFDVVEGPRTPVPVRVITVHGQGRLAPLAIEAATENLRILADYFGQPYPYRKMDLVGVPEFGAGAMENPGLVTFREEALLFDPARASTGARRGLESIVAHEFAHQWFGDLVTMAWWNDLWLNEGFATWMQARANDTWHPQSHARVDALSGRAAAMETDALPAARAVRQPVRSTSDAMSAFDSITYQKGAAVLSMIEQWLGEDTFRTGVRDYLHAHEWGSARAEDLFASLGRASGRDVAGVAATFVDQPGVPLVRADLDCTGAAPTLVLSQSPYAVAGGADATATRGGTTWRIPVCVAYGAASGAPRSRMCVVLDGPSLRAPLEGMTRCPAWLEPNAEEAGYYRYELTAPVRALATASVRAQLDERERAGLVQDLWALVRGGRLGADDMLRLLDGMRGEHARSVVNAIATSLSSLLDDVADGASRTALRTWIANWFRPLTRELGWAPRRNDDDDARLNRRVVLSMEGQSALDPTALSEAHRVAQRYFADPHRVDPDLAAVAVPMASRHGDAAWFATVQSALAHAPTPTDRVLTLGALVSFDDPALLQRGLDITLTDAVRVQDVLRMVFTAASVPERRATVRAWVAAHFDALHAKLPGSIAGRLASLSGGTCTAETRAEATAFWQPRATQFEHAGQLLREGLERAGQCIALREREAPHVAAFFAHPAATAPRR